MVSAKAGSPVKVRGVPAGRADEVRAQTEAEPVGHTAKSALSLDRLRRFLRRLDDRFADPETVPFSPVCCPGSPVVARCEVAGRADSAVCPPGHTPHCNKRGHAMSEEREGALRVWWMPQVPGQSFEVVVPDLATAGLVCDVLARYDRFQYDNRIKPDYCNMGGVAWFHDGEWEDLDLDNEDDVASYRAAGVFA